MKVQIVAFPETPVAAVEHRGAPELEHETALCLVRWRIRNKVPPQAAQTFGIHYTDPFAVSPELHRVDFCVSYLGPVAPNEEGVAAKVIPRLRCAVTRHHGSRSFNSAAEYLGRIWLPQSNEKLGNFPMFFHYVNVGPNLKESEMITDVYLPLGPRDDA